MRLIAFILMMYMEKWESSFIKDENGYQLEMYDASIYEEVEFNSPEDAEIFKNKSVLISDYPTPNFLEKNVTFDDETLTVNWQYNTNYLNGALDILEAFLLVAYIVDIIILIVSVIVYFSRKKKIN